MWLGPRNNCSLISLYLIFGLLRSLDCPLLSHYYHLPSYERPLYQLHCNIDLNLSSQTRHIMQAQPVFSNYIDSHINEMSIYGNSAYLNNHLKKMPTAYIQSQQQQQMDYQHQYQGHGVRIAQQEEEYSYGNVGMWGLENMMEGTQKQYSEAYQYSRPLLSLSTTFEEPTYTPSHLDTNSAISTVHPDAATYSNESSPFMHNYMLPSAPRTPVTPATTPLLNGQYYTVPGVPGAFVLVPVMARDLEGNYTTVFYPKPTLLDSCVEENYSMGFSGLEEGYGHNGAYNVGLQCAPQEQQLFDYVEDKGLYMEDTQDDGPELVGMGLYDEPPELLYSTTTTPELARLNTPSSNDGRGLVLEQSFGLPEEEDDDEEEYEYEEEEVEAEQQCMRY
ncbi:hypothetical protein EV426DRAFT_216206 [Tirmania nivea]|nr:hypothetical protein EV426DRAFT_216206 [Tirmania nivea]